VSKYCTRCGHIGEPRRITPGSFLIEVVLWLFLLVPGLIYSLWRISARHNACRECGSRDVVPLTSPAAQKQIASDPSLQLLVDSNEDQKHRLSLRTKLGLAFVGSIAVLVVCGMILDAVTQSIPH
jgi:hypothetical protein